MPKHHSDRYRQIALLGEGANGRVWLVEDEAEAGAQMALKEVVAPGEGVVAELRHEFGTLATLRHPGIPRPFVFDSDPVSGLPRFSLEYIVGRPFLAACQDGEPSDVLRYVGELLQILAFVHDFGLVHRDLKPPNLIVRNQVRLGFRLAVLDFGLSAPATDLEGRPTGTLPYLSPEMLAGESGSVRSDLYAVGAVTYEALHGEPPFNPTRLDLRSFIAAVTEGKKTRPACHTHYPPGMSDWIEQMLAPAASNRPPTAAEALARLNDYCGTQFDIDTSTARSARLASGAPPGRDETTNKLLSVLQDTASAQVVWLTGGPGSGKSRVLSWLEAEAVRRGWWVHRLAVNNPSPSPLSRESNGPVLTLLDEAERASSSLVSKLLRDSAAGTQSLVVLALRHNEIEDPRLQDLLKGQDLLPHSHHLSLGPLDQDGVKALLGRATGGRGSFRQLIEPILHGSDGNPALAVPLVVGGRPAANQEAEEVLQHSLASRVDDLEPSLREWLDALCVLGGPVSRSVVDRLAPSQHDLDLNELRHKDLAEFSPVGWTPASRRVSRHVLGRLTQNSAVDLYRRAAGLLAANPEASPALLARLWKGARDTDRSIEAALRAAAAASDAAETASWYRFAALQLPRDDSRRGQVRADHGFSLLASGQLKPAASAFATAARLATSPETQATLLAHRARALAMLGRTGAARSCAAKAMQVAERSDSLLGVCEAEYALALAHHLATDFEAALSVATNAAAKSQQFKGSKLDAEVHTLLGAIGTALGDYATAERSLREGLQSVDPEREPEIHVHILVSLGRVFLRQHRFDEAKESFRSALEHARRSGLEAKTPTILQNYGAALAQLGQLDIAVQAAREAGMLSAHVGRRMWWLLSAVLEADILRMCGRPGEGASLLRKALRAARLEVEPATHHYARLTLVECLLHSPDPQRREVEELLQEVDRAGERDRRVATAVLATRLEAEARFNDSIPETWQRWLTFVESHDVEPTLRIRAVTARARIEFQSSDCAAAVTHAREAAELAEKHSLPLLAARAWSLLSEAHEALSQPEQARQALNTGKAQLDDAASRIEDTDMRRDLLARPDFERLRRSQADSTQQQQPDRLLALYDMIHALNSETDPDLVLESILDMALRVVQAERGLILLRRPNTDDYAVRMARNLERETIEDAARFSRKVVLQSGAGRAVLAMDTKDGEALSEYKSLGVYGIRSVICVPLRSRGGIVGAVYLDDRREGGMFTPEDLRFLEAFADHAALALRNAQERRELERRNEALQVAAESRSEFAGIVGSSPPMQRVFDLIKKAAEVPLPVLVQGESGTGKELVARAIHFNGPRKKAAFLSENCAAIPETLLESELFGHVRGAFTGAERDRQGLFEQADGGSLFLDEVGDMSVGMQARLLRVLQEGELRRVGGSQPVHVDVRVIAATHRDLAAEVEAGRFREDLFYRLNVLSIQLPPLRDRAGDVGRLIDHMLRGIARTRGRAVPPLTGEVADALERYHWPGNVRQLENTLQRLVVLAGDQPIDRALLQADPTLARTLLAEAREPSPVLSLAHKEREQILTALEATGGNKARAAKLLGISRATIFRKIKDLNLK